MLTFFIIFIIVYFVAVFFVLRLLVPHSDFGYDPLPKKLDLEIKIAIDKLRDKASSAEEFLKLTYDFIGSKYRSERFNTVLKFGYLYKNINEVWRMNGYMPCPQTNYLVRIFLIRSGWFKDEDIRKRYIFVNFVPHQYLQVRVNGQWIDLDVGEKRRGFPLGKHLKYFG